MPLEKGPDGKAELHSTGVFKVFAHWANDGSLEKAFSASFQHLAEENKLDLSLLHGEDFSTVAKKGATASVTAGHKHQKGQKMIAPADNHGYGLSSLTIAPVNKTDMVLLADGLQDLNRVATVAGLEFKGATLNLDTGFDSKAKRKHVFNAGLKPNIAENPRPRQTPSCGHPRFFDTVLYALRFTIESVLAWEDKFKRLLLRFESKQKRHLGFKLSNFTLINLREFCEG